MPRLQDLDTEQHIIEYFDALIEIKLRRHNLALDKHADVKKDIARKVPELIRANSGLHLTQLGPKVLEICNAVLRDHCQDNGCKRNGSSKAGG